jgi:predicted Fe-Mo cluster-binding NifX family protein
MHMHIAIVTETESPNSVISAEFGKHDCVSIIDVDSMTIVFSSFNQNLSLVEIARRIVESDCEALICGDLFNEEVFSILSDAGVTRYNGSKLTILKAIDRMMNNRLPLIKDVQGGTGCQNHNLSSKGIL